MRSLSVLLLVVFFVVGQTRFAQRNTHLDTDSDLFREFRRLYREYQRRDNSDDEDAEDSYERRDDNYSPTVSYHFHTNTSQPFVGELTSEGEQGYDYLTSGSDSSWKPIYIYGDMHGNSSKYSYHILPEPETASEFMEQLMSEGAQDLTQPDVKYVYRHLSAPADLDELTQQIEAQAYDGYLYVGFYNYEGASSLFIRDDSQDSKFIAKKVSSPTSAKTYLEQMNEYGANGYRVTRLKYMVSQTLVDENGRQKWWNFALYYRDITKPDASYTYGIQPKPTTFDGYKTQIKEQGDKGFLLTEVASTRSDSACIYFDLAHCNCGGIIIELLSVV